MFCTHCGHKNPNEAKFCGNCGKPITATHSPQDETNNIAQATPASPPANEVNKSKKDTQRTKKGEIRCSFCGKPASDVRRLIAGPGVYICNECVELCYEIIEEEMDASCQPKIENEPSEPAKKTQGPDANAEIAVTHAVASPVRAPDVPALTATRNSFSDIVRFLETASPLHVRKGGLTRLTWFVLANAAIVLSVSIISGGTLVGAMPYLIAISSLFPFLALLFSRWLAMRSHRIALIDEATDDEAAKALRTTVKQLALRAGLKKVPQVGIYESPDMNAFATGFSRNSALVAFSSGLVQTLDDKSIAAVAAHEISHIANGDMVTLALVQSVVNTIVNLITIPLRFINIVAVFDQNIGDAVKWMFTIFRWVLTILLLFFGSLVVRAFSRHREFKADALAARLLDKEAMIGALEALSHDTIHAPRLQRAYSSLKIHSPSRLWDIFSTHPSVERRIKALQKLSI